MRVLFVSDNPHLKEEVESIVRAQLLDAESTWVESRSLDFDNSEWWSQWDVVFSIHCKRIFPASILGMSRFYNLHPGLNPYNRGWFPQVFHILNGLPIGATLHEIDGELDHGRIVAQKEIQTFAWDTSVSIYDRVLKAEVELMTTHLQSVLRDNYVGTEPIEEGNVNWKRDYDSLCELNMASMDTMARHLDLLRALSHPPYRNAFFLDESGNKVYVEVKLTLEK